MSGDSDDNQDDDDQQPKGTERLTAYQAAKTVRKAPEPLRGPDDRLR